MSTGQILLVKKLLERRHKVRGKTLRIFVRGQSPRSLKSVELSNWTGMAFMGERAQIQSIRQIDDLADTGIYLLLATPEDSGSGLTQIYIGETENFSNRIAYHRKKDWWTQFVVFVSKDRNLTKAHVRFLEQKLYSLAKKAVSTLKIMNDSEPSGSKLPESDEASMEEFLENMIFVLETLGLSYFPNEYVQADILSQTSNIAKPDYTATVGMEFYIKVPNTNERAFMRIEEGKFIMKAGSFIRAEPAESFKDKSYYTLWDQIVTSDAVEKDEALGLFKTVRDLEFRSPSAAGAVARGLLTNGRKRWHRMNDDKPLFECEAEDIDEAA